MAEVARLDIVVNSAQAKAGADQVRSSLDQMGAAGEAAAAKIEGAFDRMQARVLAAKASLTGLDNAATFKQTVQNIAALETQMASMRTTVANTARDLSGLGTATTGITAKTESFAQQVQKTAQAERELGTATTQAMGAAKVDTEEYQAALQKVLTATDKAKISAKEYQLLMSRQTETNKALYDASEKGQLRAAQATERLNQRLKEQQTAATGAKGEVQNLKNQQTGTTAATSDFTRKLQDAIAALTGKKTASKELAADVSALGRVILASGGNFRSLDGALMNGTRATGLMAAALNPIGITILAITAAVGGLALAWNSYNQKVAETIAVTTGLGRYLGMSSKAFEDMAEAAGSAGRISTAQALELAAAFARTGTIGQENMRNLIQLSKDFAVTMGVDVKTAGDILAKTFSDPAQGIQTLNQQLAFLDTNTMKTVQSLIAQGKAQEAIRLTIERMPSALARAEEATASWSRAWDKVTTAASNAWMAIGRAIDRAVFGPDQSQRLQDIKAQLDAIAGAEERRKWIGLGTNDLEVRRNQLLKEQEAIQQTLLKEGLERRAAAMRAEINRTSNEVSDLAKSVAPATAELQRLKDQLTNLQRGQGLPPGMIGDQKSYKDAIDATSRAIETYLSPAEKARRLNEIDLQLIRATDAATRARLQSERQRVELAGQVITREQASIAIQQAGATVLATANKERQEEFRILDEQNRLFGLVGPQRELELQLLERVQAARRSGNAYSKEEIELLRQKLKLQQDLNAVQQQLDSIYNQIIKPQEDYKNGLQAANQLLAEGKINLEQYNRVLTDLKIKSLEAANTLESGLQAALLKIMQDYNNVTQTLYTGISNITRKLEDTLVDFVKTGKFNFKDLADTVITEVIRMTIRLMVIRPLLNAIFGPLAGGGGGLGGLLGGLFKFHDGGIVGEKQQESMPAASVLQKLFQNNINAQEQVALLKKGEEVLTEDDPRHTKNLNTMNSRAAASAGDNTGTIASFLALMPKYHDGGVVGDQKTDFSNVVRQDTKVVQLTSPSGAGEAASPPIQVTLNVNGVTDAVSFRKSQGQIAASTAAAIDRAKRFR